MNFGGAASGSSSSHVEYRMWDSSLDPGTIQTQVKLSLGMTQAAFASPQPAGAPMPVGAHRAANAGLGRGRRLRAAASGAAVINPSDSGHTAGTELDDRERQAVSELCPGPVPDSPSHPTGHPRLRRSEQRHERAGPVASGRVGPAHVRTRPPHRELGSLAGHGLLPGGRLRADLAALGRSGGADGERQPRRRQDSVSGETER